MNTGEAERALCHLRQLDPTLRLSNLKDWILLLRPQDLERLQDGLKRAGLS